LSGGELFITTNGGISWINKKEVIHCNTYPPVDLIFDNQKTLFCRCDNSSEEILSLYTSTNLGKSFNKKTFNFDSLKYPQVFTSDIKKIEDKIYQCFNIYDTYTRKKNNFIAKIDSSLNLEIIFKIPELAYCWETFSDSHYIIGTENGILITKNKGTDWESANIIGPIRCLTKISTNEILALGLESIYLSGNNGMSWNRIYNLRSIDKEIYYFEKIYHGNGDTVYATGNGFYISIDKGLTWDLSNKGLNAINIQDLAFDEMENVFCATYNGVYKSENYGKTWEASGLFGFLLSCITLSNKGDIFTSGNYNGIGVARSTDGGASWSIFTEGLIMNLNFNPRPINDLYINNKGYVFAGDGGGNNIFISKDNGTTWNLYKDAIGSNYFTLNNQGYLFGSGGPPLQISMSTDDGETWSSVLFSSGFDISCMNGIKSINFTKRKPYGTSSCGYSTKDNGLSWSKDKLPDTKFPIAFVDSLDNYYYYNGRNDQYIFYTSSDQGLNWDTLNTGIFHYIYNNPITKIFVSPNGYIFIAVENGGLYRSRKRFVSVEENSKRSNEIVVTPNPATDFIEISVINPMLKHGVEYLDIKILNIYGQTVLSVGVQNLEPLRVDVSGLATGIYFVRIGDKVSKFIKL
jgi:photosystem II stability/assembly factor-like uncharacterized protein